MLAMFCFFSRETEEAIGGITVHEGSLECDQLKVAGYSYRLYEHDTARNYVDTQGDFEALAARYQPELHYAGMLPVKLDGRGNAYFGGLLVGQARPWGEDFTEEPDTPHYE